MKKKAKIIWIGGLVAVALIFSILIFWYSKDSNLPYTRGKLLQEKIIKFALSLQDTSWIDPQGRFLDVRIVGVDPDERRSGGTVFFTVPADKIEQFEKGYREAIRTAENPYGWNIDMWKIHRLEITTEKKTYKVYISWTNKKIYFKNGMESSDLRKVFFDVGLGEPSTDRDEKTNEGPQ